MGKITLITGGARSGKSTFAEELLKGKDSVLYIATAMASDSEMKERIGRHRSRRNPKWETVEAYKDLGELVKAKCKDRDYILLDCITLLVTNLMILENDVNWDNIDSKLLNKIEEGIKDEVDNFLDALNDFEGEAIIVTNELGMGIVPEYPLPRYYRDIAGKINQQIARVAHEVYLTVSGIPVKIKPPKPAFSG
ncbi:bifunctional adenosylcobinamide kinase/adenosylcobinamide-phosphate guanylyltransferase [Spirochaetota bacterium]